MGNAVVIQNHAQDFADLAEEIQDHQDKESVQNYMNITNTHSLLTDIVISSIIIISVLSMIYVLYKVNPMTIYLRTQLKAKLEEGLPMETIHEAVTVRAESEERN